MTDSTRLDRQRNPEVAWLLYYPPKFRPLAAMLMLAGHEPSVPELTALLGYSHPRTVERLLSEMEDAGLIEVHRHPGKRSWRYLTTPAGNAYRGPFTEQEFTMSDDYPRSPDPRSPDRRSKGLGPRDTLFDADSASYGNGSLRAGAREAHPDPKPVNVKQAAVSAWVDERRVHGTVPNQATKKHVGSVAHALWRDGSGTEAEVIEAARRTAADLTKGPGWIKVELQRLQDGQPSVAAKAEKRKAVDEWLDAT